MRSILPVLLQLLLCAALLLVHSRQSAAAAADLRGVQVEHAPQPGPAVAVLRIDPSHDSQQFEIASTEALPAPVSNEQPEPLDSSPSTADEAASSDESRVHRMRPLQSSSVFDMQLRTANAPFSRRIQPGLMYRTREISYTQVGTGLRVRLGAGYLMMYEGAMRNRSGATVSIENDVWVSNDDGITWDLIAGRSEYGVSGPISSPNNFGRSFEGRSGSNNCNDPLSDLTISLGGNNAITDNSTTVTYSSYNGIVWTLQTVTPWGPQRHFSSCDITNRGDVLLIGGHFHTASNQPADYLLNDVWHGTGVIDSAYALTWRRVTDAAPFAAREEHLVLVGYSAFFKKEIVYVIGGRVTCTNSDCYNGIMANDVWASSDLGRSWALITAAAPFGPRWGHAGWWSRGEALLVLGGLNSPTGAYGDTMTQRDVWVSFDGGYSWSQCGTSSTGWIRGEQGVAVNANGQLVLTSGYAYTGFLQERFNDVWRSMFSVEDNYQLAARCGGAMPAAGVGLRRWPGYSAAPANTFIFSALTQRAPWSPRWRPGLLLMSTPLTYKTPDGTTATTGANWLLLYEGMGLVSSNPNSNENDVYASADSGQTWTLISGVALRGQMGNKNSAYPTSSFTGSISSANCEDPLNDDVYSIGGLRWNGTVAGFWSTDDVWYSSNALQWQRQSGKVSSPARHGATCDVGHSHNVILIGGMHRRYEGGLVETYYNDVWTSSNKGASWTRVTLRAAFTARRDHAMQITRSEYYGVDLIYVVGGRGIVGTAVDSFNDVWVSSNGGSSWKALLSKSPWNKRFEASVVVTSTGSLLMLGGRGQTDMWASFNGGVKWTACRLVGNESVSDSSAVTLTADDRLVIASGWPRADVLQSEQKLSDAALVSRYCTGSIPAEGVGLRVEGWEPGSGDNGGDGSSGTDPSDPTINLSSLSGSGLSGLAIVGIVAAALLLLVVAFFCWRYHKRGAGRPLQSSSDLTGSLLSTSSLEAQRPAAGSLGSSLAVNDSSRGL